MSSRFSLWLSVCLLIISSCSKGGLERYREYLYDPGNGLSKTLVINHTEFNITYWPANLVQFMGLGNPGMIFFEIRAGNSQELYAQTETNFKMISNGREYFPDIVFAENAGFDQGRRLLIGFSDYARARDFELIHQSYSGQALSSASFDRKHIQRIENLKIDR